MVHLDDIRYVRLGTQNLDVAIDYATRILGLQLVTREKKTAYFRANRASSVSGDVPDHNLVYFEGNPKDQATGFVLKNPQEFEAIATELDRAGHPVIIGTKEDCEKRRVRQVMSFQDPSGNRIELIDRPYYSGSRFYPSRAVGICEFSHIGLYSKDPVRDERFWTQVCNARVSDWFGDAPLLRIKTRHHTIAIFQSDTHAGLQHINYQVEDIDTLMQSYYFLREQGVKIIFGPGRHPLSTAIMLYFQGPDKMVYEYSLGVKHILPEQEASYRPRQFPVTPVSSCMWGSKPNVEDYGIDIGDADTAKFRG